MGVNKSKKKSDWIFNENLELVDEKSNKKYTRSRNDEIISFVNSNVEKILRNKHNFKVIQKNKVLLCKRSLKKILVILSGSGKKQGIGVMSLGLSIYDNLYKGSVISLVEAIVEKTDSSICILEYNKTNPHKFITECWKSYFKEFNSVGFVAHSFGGCVALHLILSLDFELIQQKIQFLCFCDSVHEVYIQKGAEKSIENEKKREFLSKHCVNWVACNEEIKLGEIVKEKDIVGCKCVSAGVSKHAHTFYSSLDQVVDIITEKL